ncbi:hypothetical protein [Kitasatospora sp. LaBMicrA B282]|uniref:hypothetical protein n=1 Tax=Kitasatospora sp. LaBMicrA B282 TaxID=3420949 RepID=UPI003D13D58A
MADHDPGAADHCPSQPGHPLSTALALDVLTALDKPLPTITYPRSTTEPFSAMATAWMHATPITRLTLLRAHLLATRPLTDLLTLHQRTGVHLRLVCHQRGLSAALEAVLRDVEHHRLEVTTPPAAASAAQERRRPRPRWPAVGRWLDLPALTTLCSFDGAQRRCRCIPRRAEEVGFRPPVLRPASAAKVARRLHRASSRPNLVVGLATAVFTAACDVQLSTAHHADVVADAASITLHDPGNVCFGCLTHRVPVWARPLLQAARYYNALASAGERPLFSDPYRCRRSLDLIALAEACRLRPPQPPGTSSRSPAKPKWPVSNAHLHYPWTLDEISHGCPQTTPTRSAEPDNQPSKNHQQPYQEL